MELLGILRVGSGRESGLAGTRLWRWNNNVKQHEGSNKSGNYDMKDRGVKEQRKDWIYFALLRLVVLLLLLIHSPSPFWNGIIYRAYRILRNLHTRIQWPPRHCFFLHSTLIGIFALISDLVTTFVKICIHSSSDPHPKHDGTKFLLNSGRTANNPAPRRDRPVAWADMDLLIKFLLLLQGLLSHGKSLLMPYIDAFLNYMI
jgi:hypothetical protein